LQSHLDEELALKKHILEEQKEINNLMASINRREDTVSRTISEAIPGEEVDEEMISSSMISNSNRDRLSQLKKNWEKDTEKLRDMTKKREVMIQGFYKSGVKDFYYEYVQMMLKNHHTKMNLLDNTFDLRLNQAVFVNKETYIQELENQIKIRDDFLKQKGYNIIDDDTYKCLDNLKTEYSQKLPIIKTSFKTESANNNLPPISINSINNIINDVKLVGLNINRIESKSKMKPIRQQSDNKYLQAKNYSQNRRNNIPVSRNNSKYKPKLDKSASITDRDSVLDLSIRRKNDSFSRSPNRNNQVYNVKIISNKKEESFLKNENNIFGKKKDMNILIQERHRINKRAPFKI
jgi:hypothetical protein